MHITHQAVQDLAERRNMRFSGPGLRLDGYDFYLYHNKPDGLPSMRCALMSFDIADVCRFLGQDGVTGYAGHGGRHRSPDTYPTVVWLDDPVTHERHRVEGPVPLVI